MVTWINRVFFGPSLNPKGCDLVNVFLRVGSLDSFGLVEPWFSLVLKRELDLEFP